MAKRTLNEKRALVTGASSGIGRELALELARHGVRQVVVARREEPLATLVDEIRALGCEAEMVPGDITDPAIRDAAIDRALATFGGLDLLVNNAGIGGFGSFRDAGPQRLRSIMEVNFFSAAEMIRTALPHLEEGDRPMVVNISSVLGHRGVPNCAEYCASKFALQGLGESLRAEFVEWGIDLLTVCPSTTQSEFFSSAIERTEKMDWESRPSMTAAAVAQKTVRAIRRGKHEIVLSFFGKLMVWGNRHNPRLLDYLVTKWG